MIAHNLLVILGLVAHSCLGQIPTPGSCPEKKSLQPVDFRTLTGVWYELERTPSIAEWSYKCITFKLQPFFELKSSLTVTGVNRFTEKLETHTVPLKIPAESAGTHDGMVIANMTTNGYSIHPTPVQVLAMDNSTSIQWIVVWGCRDFEIAQIRTESIWVFAKMREPDDSTWSEIRHALVRLNLEHTVLRETVQKNCRGREKEEDYYEYD